MILNLILFQIGEERFLLLWDVLKKLEKITWVLLEAIRHHSHCNSFKFIPQLRKSSALPRWASSLRSPGACAATLCISQTRTCSQAPPFTKLPIVTWIVWEITIKILQWDGQSHLLKWYVLSCYSCIFCLHFYLQWPSFFSPNPPYKKIPWKGSLNSTFVIFLPF